MIHSHWLSVVSLKRNICLITSTTGPVVRSIVGKIEIDEEIFGPKEIDTFLLLSRLEKSKSASKHLLSPIGTPDWWFWRHFGIELNSFIEIEWIKIVSCPLNHRQGLSDWSNEPSSNRRAKLKLVFFKNTLRLSDFKKRCSGQWRSNLNR